MRTIILLLIVMFSCASCCENQVPDRPTKTVRAQAYWYCESCLEYKPYNEVRIITVDTLYKVGDWLLYHGLRHKIIE